jgi:hypothetical protein
MGMDVYGQSPRSETGEYFRKNVRAWHPLADYIQVVAPEIASNCKYWHTNDGDGLNAEHATALADRLDAEIRSGRCERYARMYESKREMAPDVPCWLCEGTGTRKPVPLAGAGDLFTGEQCNACGGKGTVRPWSTCESFDVEHVREFITFLRACGGFEIL